MILKVGLPSLNAFFSGSKSWNDKVSVPIRKRIKCRLQNSPYFYSWCHFYGSYDHLKHGVVFFGTPCSIKVLVRKDCSRIRLQSKSRHWVWSREGYWQSQEYYFYGSRWGQRHSSEEHEGVSSHLAHLHCESLPEDLQLSEDMEARQVHPIAQEQWREDWPEQVQANLITSCVLPRVREICL